MDGRAKAALKLILPIAMAAEGLRQTAYYDPPGILSTCFGSTQNVEIGRVYTLGECLARLDADMTAAIATVERCVPGLPVRPLAAFGDAVYNLGGTIVCDTEKSTAARYLKAGRIEDACRELPKWSKAKILGQYVTLPGLAKRRRAEMSLCLGYV